MEKQYMIVAGRAFEVKNPSVWIPSSKGELEYCYAKPSERKKNIMKSWLEWANSIPGYVNMWVHSYNVNFFTIGGEIWDIDNKHYAFYITRTRQEIWEVI